MEQTTTIQGLERLLDKDEVSSILNVTTRTITNLMKQKRIAYVKVGRSVKFKKEDVLNYIDASYYRAG